MAPRYVFHSVWQVPVGPDVVFEALADFESYPRWWPEVRAVTRIDADSAETLCRSFLPYDLRFVTTTSRLDPEARVLEGRLAGDLDGFSRWVVEPDGDGSRLVYDQEVTTHKRLLNALAPVARPAFRVNHTLMMRHGEAGLRRYLSRSGGTPR